MPLFGQNAFDQDVGKFDSLVLYRSVLILTGPISMSYSQNLGGFPSFSDHFL